MKQGRKSYYRMNSRLTRKGQNFVHNLVHITRAANHVQQTVRHQQAQVTQKRKVKNLVFLIWSTDRIKCVSQLCLTDKIQMLSFHKAKLKFTGLKQKPLKSYQ